MKQLTLSIAKYFDFDEPCHVVLLNKTILSYFEDPDLIQRREQLITYIEEIADVLEIRMPLIPTILT